MQLLLVSIGALNLLQIPGLQSGANSISVSLILTLVVSAIVTSVLAKLLRDWLRKRLLIKLGFDQGTREAIATITSYGFGAFWFVVILQTAGVNLNSLTFLAGGLGIGLGFGLQELAKNFISGLTLLFEQPIKVGDFIELDGLTGTVEKISIRATMIRTNDGISVIVPNLNFVVNKIINWSHQDPKCRLHLSVGVAEHCDLILVTELLLAAAYLESRVLTDPAPEVRLLEFGDGTVNLSLLVWISQPVDKDPIMSALRFAIEHKFRQHGIQPYGTSQALSVRSVSLPSLISAATLPSETHIDSSGQPSQTTLRELLRKVSYFDGFTDLNLLQLIQQGCRQSFKAGVTIFREDEIGDSFYIILSGSIEVFSERANKHLTTLHSGDFFGELSLLMGIRRTATVQTLEDTVLFVVSRNGMQKLLENHRGLADLIAEKLAERQQELSQRQQLLKALGLLDEVDLEQNPIIWIRKRLKVLFNA